MMKHIFELESTALDGAIRISDDIKQKEKGQPSLDDEDTGERFLNEKEK